MFFPISDDDRHLLKPAYVSISLLVINVALFLYQLANPAFTMGWSVIPAEITSGSDLVGPHYIGDRILEQHQIDHVAGPSPIYLTLLSSMFMHGGWMHLGLSLIHI